MAKIIIADDHQMVLEGLELIIGGVEGVEVISTVMDGKMLLAQVDYFKPDMVVLDINMPNVNGIEATRILKSDFPRTKILVVSMHNEEGIIRQVVKAGADGYVLKNTGKVELTEAVTSILKGRKYFSEALQIENLESNDIPVVEFSDREMEVLKHINLGLNPDEIAEKMFISKFTVYSHKKNMMTKTNSKSTVELLHYAREYGILMD